MRKQTESRTYPPLSSSAAWGGGSSDNRNGTGQQAGGKSGCRGRIGAMLVGCLLFLGALPAFARSPKLAADLNDSNGSRSVDVIVQFNQTPTQKHFDRVRAKGGKLKTALGSFKGAAFSVPASALDNLADDPEVTYITPDRPVHGMQDWTEQAVNANIAWNYGYDGTGVGVAVIDSGMAPVTDLNKIWTSTSRVVYSQDFTGSGSTSDGYGHGTHVAGIIGGSGQSSTGPSYSYTIKGVSPNVNLINLRVLDSNGWGTDSAVIAAIQRAISLKNTYNIRVMNLSLGRQVYESYVLDPLCQAVEQAWNAGIVVVVAAGNQGRNNSAGTNGYGTIAAPGNDPYAITVGAMKGMETATRGDDLITTYSSKGPTAYDLIVKPDIVAPGNYMMSLLAPNSTLVTQYPGNAVTIFEYRNSNNGAASPYYFRLSGTSMATPVVSGAAALLIQKNPTLSPDTVKARLMKSASKNFPATSSWTDPSTGITYTSQYDIFTIGAGYLDVYAALQSNDLVLAPLTAQSPTVHYDSVSGYVYLINGTSVVWGTSVLWGDSVVWGSSVLWGDSVLWGNSVVWGSSTSSGFSVIWGASVLWGSTSQDVTEATNISVNGE